ncbi:Serine carboxypeptidase [Botrimarina colliarenosi]|uniref:Serine carboxypeptidase n=1 Tax=Botrimarina colliarenosi TaxID=2528001 RepID=A0A5C6A752_9BACT|nr:peptidase S10 [Botrimarina colliarenosi]TWT95197.1 Serine carboxypeptidase [Botrimarina colliarenosi]
MIRRFFVCCFVFAIIGCHSVASADDKTTSKSDKTEKSEKEDAKDKKEDDETPKLRVTTGAVTIDGEEVAYVATAGKLPQKHDGGDAKAEIFFVAYTRGGLGDDGQAEADPDRPVTFCFNGGPGASSVWLHLGMLGPKRVRLPDDASFPEPPYKLVANPYSLLDVTDLVFIDPVGTGYSRPTEGEKREQFHGLEEDLRSVGLFIHDYTTKFRRWESPKFILGESYGGLRAGGLSDLLQDRYHMYLNGVVLVSAVLDFSTLGFADNNDLPYVLFLPGYAATAWRHKALDDDLLGKPLTEVVAEAEAFAAGDFADALLQGAAMPAEKRKEVVAEAARLTGLSEEYLEATDLRVSMWRFSKELLRGRNQLIGRYDSRYVGPGVDGAGESMDYDPSDAAFEGIFCAGMNAYLADDLDYQDDRVYETLTSVQPWNYKPFINRYVTTAERLRDAMVKNPALEVFAACGYFDLATPAFAMKHTRDHTMTTDALRERFTTGYYEGGHMMYVHEPSLEKLRKDLVEWYEKASE